MTEKVPKLRWKNSVVKYIEARGEANTLIAYSVSAGVMELGAQPNHEGIQMSDEGDTA